MSQDKKTPKDILEGLRSGNREVIKNIYKEYYTPIEKMVKSKNGTKEDSYDVFQEGLMLIYQKSRSSDFNLRSSFLTYFYAVCKNIWSNKLRKRTNQEVTLDDKMLLMFKDDAVDMWHNNERHFLYRKMFLKLGNDCQRVLELFLQKVKMAEIMRIMEYGSISYAKKKKFQCKKKLIDLIQEDPSYNELRILA